MKKTQHIALVSIMGALALIFSILKLEVPFPVLTYLKFDLAEIPSFTAFFLCGLGCGSATAIIHFVGLLFRGSDPLGASMKLAAVLSTIVGMKASKTLYGQIVFGTFSRVLVMTIANAIYFYLIFPEYILYVENILSANGIGGGMLAVFVLTGIFNMIHSIFSIIVSWKIVNETKKRINLD